jgi:CheY-like chemotaxis protein
MALILIVEDTDTAAPLEIALASLNGVKTMLVANGRDALALVKTSSVELAAIITDLQLPFVDGFELIAAVRSDTRNSRLPIIVISGNSDPEDRSRVSRLGANAFFTKPYSPAEVRRMLEGLLHAP